MTFSISNDFLTANFHSKGAELFSLKTNNKDFIWNGNPDFWSKHSPILFPIVGTLKNNSYSVYDQEYQLSRHGFARNLAFLVTNQTKSSITFSLKANEKTLDNYPFEFELQIKYELIEKTLITSFEVKNNSDNNMPFSIGAHPAFSLPKSFENYSLEFSNDEILNYYLLENGLISAKNDKLVLENKILQLNYKKFEKDALVFKKINSKSITILENSKPYLKINFEKFPNLGIWTVQNANFICIEPWFGYSDTTTSNGNLFQKEGIIALEKKQVFQAHYSIEII